MSNFQKKPKQKYIRCLERRKSYLDERIKRSDLDLTYDKAELNALNWAIGVLKELYPAQEKIEEEAENREAQQ